jgi:hypothetical protein
VAGRQVLMENEFLRPRLCAMGFASLDAAYALLSSLLLQPRGFMLARLRQHTARAMVPAPPPGLRSHPDLFTEPGASTFSISMRMNCIDICSRVGVVYLFRARLRVNLSVCTCACVL